MFFCGGEGAPRPIDAVEMLVWVVGDACPCEVSYDKERRRVEFPEVSLRNFGIPSKAPPYDVNDIIRTNS